MNTASSKLLSDSRWPEVKFLIKATDHEQFYLWREYGEQGLGKDKAFDWITIGESKSVVVDIVDNKPIAVCFTFVKLNDVVVAFYDGISRLVDWDVITNWLKEIYKGKWKKDRPAVCGVGNFKDCLTYIHDKKTREVGQEKT